MTSELNLHKMDSDNESTVNEQTEEDGSNPSSVVRDILPDSPVLSENLMSNDTIKLERSGSEDSKTILHTQLRASLERTLQQLSGDSASENGKFVILYQPPKFSKNFFLLIPKKKTLVKDQNQKRVNVCLK